MISRTGWLFAEHEKGRYQVRTDDVHAFFDKVAATRGPKAKPFSAYGKLRAARDLLRMATDLGMLAGDGPIKNFASIAMSDDVTMFYAHMIADLEGNAAKMPSRRLWRRHVTSRHAAATARTASAGRPRTVRTAIAATRHAAPAKTKAGK